MYEYQRIGIGICLKRSEKYDDDDRLYYAVCTKRMTF